jgi:serine protease
MAKKPNVPKPPTGDGVREEGQLRLAVKLKSSEKRIEKLDGWQRDLEMTEQQFEPLALMPLIESLSQERIAQLVDQARSNDPNFVDPNFSSWFQVVTPKGLRPDELVRALSKMEEVESVHVMRPGPPPVSPADDPRNTNQGYENAAPDGIDARYAWGFPNGDGTGIGFVDMEQGWNLGHEDLSAAGITLISGVNKAYFSHGTAVLGEVLMVDNTIGGVGIAPAASGRVISQHRSAVSYNTPDAILDALANMVYGDMLLLEAQEFDPVGGQYFWPVEIADANYDAIRLASALGIVVVEAGCNGGYNLNTYVNAGGKRIFDRTSADFRDSGAIMVGAGSSVTPHARLSFSNFGNRIDCYAWGEGIDTTSTNGAGTDNALYTTSFGGTSGASPIVVGAALIVQSLAQASLGHRFSPLEIRKILTTNGTPSANPSADEIGVMPDLRAIINDGIINLAPDLYLRDQIGDNGNPTNGMVSSSPDIIVRRAAVADPIGSFGSGSGSENNPALSEDVETGHDQFIYLRLLNRGGSAASNVSADVYWSRPSTLVTPNLWSLIGSVALPAVPSGNSLTVSNALVWPSASIPAPGHYCFIAVAGNALDPKPGPAMFGTFNQFVSYISNNNNVAWRNFNVIAGPPSAGEPPGRYAFDFIIPGAFDTGHRFELESIGRLPEGSRVMLEVPLWLADALKPHPRQIKCERDRGVAMIPLHPSGVSRIGSAMLHAKSEAKCRLTVRIPEKQKASGQEFAVRQIFDKTEVGRLTWHFAGDLKS